MDSEHLLMRQSDSPFNLRFNLRNGVLSGLKYANDTYDTDFLFGHGLGRVELRWRSAGQPWVQSNSEKAADVRQVVTDNPDSPREVAVEYNRDSSETDGITALTLRGRFALEGDVLHWSITLVNRTPAPLEIGDLGLPMLFNTDYVRDSVTTYQQRVVRHSYVAGHGSFITVVRPNGVGPFLVITPQAGTKLEYFTRQLGINAWEGVYTAFVHSMASGGEETRGTWRQPHTSVILNASGSPGDSVTYGFRLQWAADYEAVRDILYSEGLLDISVVPGMTVPNDLDALVALRTRQPIAELAAEYPSETEIEYLGERGQDTHIYRLRFSRLGENLITVRYGDEQTHYLEFFTTEPLETLIKKRAAFIATKQQIRDPEKWYDGLFSLWDMQEHVLRTPDDTGGLHPYMVGGSDDPTLCKATYIAVKNVHYPLRSEIEAVEYYLRNFVWGKLQRTDAETPHPYGIYGSDNWFVNRNSPIGLNSGGNGQEHMWRTFDYTHMILLYFSMYRVASLYPELVGYLDKDGYLERAFGTARAFFVVPYNIRMGAPWDFRGWCDWAYKQGNFHELIIPSLITALEDEGWLQDADWLRGEWEKKVKYFVYDHPYPFGSEMFFDTTAFESTHMIARYGRENRMEPDTNLWQDKNTGEWYSHPSVQPQDFADFMDKQIRANIAARGWLEANYYQLGSDIRQHGNSNYLLSYMTQMGGWAILDYALYYAADAPKYARLGYASYLASWALVNSGTGRSNYGYWFPGQENDGAAGWAFEPGKYVTTWNGKTQGRGIWAYDGEIDNGFLGALRTAAAVVVDDPIFGLIAYGAQLTVEGNTLSIVPRDGLRQRLHLLDVKPHLHLVLDRDGFSALDAVVVQREPLRIAFTLENRSPDQPHHLMLEIDGLPEGEYTAYVNGEPQLRIGRGQRLFEFQIGTNTAYSIVVEQN